MEKMCCICTARAWCMQSHQTQAVHREAGIAREDPPEAGHLTTLTSALEMETAFAACSR